MNFKIIFIIQLFFIILSSIETKKAKEAQKAEEAEEAPEETEEKPEHVILKTSEGDIKIKLFWDIAPLACKNFAQLAKKGYYNDVIFHRVIRGFMIQGGDPDGTGEGGKSIYGKNFKDEFNKTVKHDKRGVVSMANSGPNTNGSQFFITLVPTPHLNGLHTIFGKVVVGDDVVVKIGKVRVRNDKPIDDVVIESTEIE